MFSSSRDIGAIAISARAVRCMLINIQLAYYSQGLPCGRARIRRVEHLAIRFCEMLAIQDLAYPRLSLYEFMAEAFMALSNIRDGLEHLVSVREE